MTAAGRGRKDSGIAAYSIVAAGIVLVLVSAAIAWLSPHFAFGQEHAERPIPLLVALLLAAGAAYAAAVRALARVRPHALGVVAIIALSLGLGAVQLRGGPLQAAQYYRYLLDGGVTACGENPYVLTPAEQRRALETVKALQPLGEATDEKVTPCLTDDARWDEVLARTESPERKTVYPPLIQYWLAATVKVAGPSILALRTSFLGAELVLLLLLAVLLARAGASPLLVGAFGLAPLVFTEIFNSVHYDIVTALLLTAAGLSLVSRRHLGALALLGLAAASQLFIIALVPLWLRAVPAARRTAALSMFVLAALLPCVPFLAAGSALLEGGWGFATQWAASSPFLAAVAAIVESGGSTAATAKMVAAILVATVVLATSQLYPLGSNEKERERACLGGSGVVLVLLLLTGPAGNPWYFVWLLPFIALNPRPAWLALIVMLPLYYVGFYLGSHDLERYRMWLLTLQFVPFVVLAGGELFYRNISSSGGRMRSAARA